MTTPQEQPDGHTKGLIERLEAAEVGSRELDVALWELFSAAKIERDLGSVRGTWPRGASDQEKSDRRVAFLAANAPRVTTSLDAALSLAERVLPGRTFIIATGGEGLDRATIDGLGTAEDCQAATAPLALCAAILRAKEQAS
jgi:hypothetical protein